jgi:DNA-binding cell septation regulator SpoVG
MKIEVLEIRELKSNGRCLKAFVDAKFDDWLIIRDFRILLAGGRLSVQLPQVSWKDPQDSSLKFKSIVHFSPEIGKRIEVTLLSAYYDWEEEKKNAPDKDL